MRRDVALIPLYLWVSASIVLHLGSMLSGEEAARYLRPDAFGAPRAPTPVAEVEFTYEPAPAPTRAVEPPAPAPLPAITPEPPRARPLRIVRRERPAPQPVPPPVVAPPPPPPPVIAQPAPPPPPPPRNMQSVDQQREDDAPRPTDPAFLAQSNHDVAEQTVATHLNRDHDDPDPHVAGQPSSQPPDEPGNSTRERVANQSEHAGDPHVAPNSGAHPDPHDHVASMSLQLHPAPPTVASPHTGSEGRVGREGAPGLESAMPTVMTATGGATGDMQAAHAGATGTDARTGRDGQGGSGGRTNDAATRVGTHGLGVRSTLAALAPTTTTYQQVFGPQAVEEQRVARLERSEARGNFTGSWRENQSAIENYVTEVRPGNQTALRTARSPFAAFLARMHVRIHHLFAEQFLVGLANQPSTSPLNDLSLVTTLEIVLERDGRLSRLGVARTSGNVLFDVGALNSVRRSAPYGAVPDEIVSGDGRVYVHWSFHRGDGQCGTWNAEPYILPGGGHAPSGTPPTEVAPPRRNAEPGAVGGGPSHSAPASLGLAAATSRD